MKLSNITAKLTCIKGNAIRVLAATVLAGAALAAAAPAAQAQHFAVGVQIGGPRYVAPAPPYYGPVYGNPGYGYGYGGNWERRRIEEERAREAAIRRDEWARHHDGYRNERGYRRPY